MADFKVSGKCYVCGKTIEEGVAVVAEFSGVATLHGTYGKCPPPKGYVRVNATTKKDAVRRARHATCAG